MTVDAVKIRATHLHAVHRAGSAPHALPSFQHYHLDWRNTVLSPRIQASFCISVLLWIEDQKKAVQKYVAQSRSEASDLPSEKP